MLSKKFIPLVLAGFAMSMLGACNNNPETSTSSSQGGEPPVSTPSSSEEEATLYTVTFYDDGAVWGTPQQVKAGETAVAPTSPTREGTEMVSYEFSGWYLPGAEVAFDFDTPVNQNLDLYSGFNEVVRSDYDLTVFVYGVNGASSPTTYITEEESNFMRDTFKSTLTDEKNILWHYVAGKKNADFNAYVVDSKLPVDLVISGNKLNNDDVSIGEHETYNKIHLGDGWIANTSRYLTITDKVNADHLDLAVKAYTLLSGIGPKYKVTLDAATLALQIGDTEQLTATYYGAGVEWSTTDAGVATVTDGLVTAVAAGTATIKAKDAAGNEAACEVTVSAAPIVPTHDLVIAINNSNANNNWMSAEDIETMMAAFTSEGQPGHGKDVKYHVISGVAIAGVVSKLEEINQDSLARVDAVLCRSAFFTNNAAKDLHQADTLVDVDTTWKYSGGEYALLKAGFEEHADLAKAFGTFVSTKNISYFEMDDSATVKLGSTYQLATVAGATYTSEDETVATVDQTGLVTPVAVGSTTVLVEKDYYYAEVSITVAPSALEAATINVYVHVCASRTEYMSDDLYNAMVAYVESTISETTTVNWIKVSGKVDADAYGNNAKVAASINEDENVVHMLIGGSGAFEDITAGANEGTEITKIKAEYVNDGQTRSMAALGGISANELACCLEIYNALKA